MSYDLTFSDFADKQLSKLPIDIQKRIISTLKRCRIRPYSHVKKLVGSKYFRLRVGDYRAIIDIIDNRLIIHVIEVGHRRNIYKKTGLKENSSGFGFTERRTKNQSLAEEFNSD